MSDSVTTKDGTSVSNTMDLQTAAAVPAKPVFNPHKEAVLNNTKTFLNDNNNETAVYLGGTLKDGKITIPTRLIRNGINGYAIRGTNQILLQNYFNKNNIKTNEVITFDQAKNNGIFVKKNAKNCTVTVKPSFNKEKNEYNPNVIREFPISECFSFNDKGEPRNPNGELALAKLNSERYRKINKLRAQLHSDKTTPEKKEALLTSIAYEHKKAIEFLAVTNGDINSYKSKSVQPEEQKILETIMPENSPVPTLDQQKGRAVVEVKKNKEYLEAHKTDVPVIDATNTTSPSDYLGKYLAACEIGAEFKTDIESQNTVKKTLSQNLQRAIDNDNHEYLETFSTECSERCRSVCAEFRTKSMDQQRGKTPEREIIQERPEQTVDAVSF